MPLSINCTAGSTVQHSELWLLFAQRFTSIFTLKNAGLEIVRRQRRINRGRRMRSRIQGNDQNAFLTRVFYYPEDTGRIVRGDENSFHSGADQVFNCGDLALIVAIELTESGDEFGALFFRFRGCGLTQLNKVRVNFGFRDEADNDLVAGSFSHRNRLNEKRARRTYERSGGELGRTGDVDTHIGSLGF